jgi:hypothetical protein
MFTSENGPGIETVSMRLNFSEIPLTYGMMTVPWYIVSDVEWLFLDGFIIKSINSCGYSLSVPV